MYVCVCMYIYIYVYIYIYIMYIIFTVIAVQSCPSLQPAPPLHRAMAR